MTIQTNTTDRKALAWAIAEELHTDCRYMRAPTYAYQIGDFMVDRDGNIVGDDFSILHDFLLRNGYITEEAESISEADWIAEETDLDPEAEQPAEEPDPDHEAERSAEEPDLDHEAEQAAEETEPDLEAEQSAEDLEPDYEAARPAVNTDDQIITLPTPDITVAQLKNLTYTLYSRQVILNLMTGGDTVHIPSELIDALKESQHETPEDFSALLDSFRDRGLKGFDFRDGQFSLTFPFYEHEPMKWTTFAELQRRILQSALSATRVFPEVIEPAEDAQKYAAYMWLQRLGYRGPEVKFQRDILLKHLHGYCAFSNAEKMKKHSDRYGAQRRERREAERAAGIVIAREETNAEGETASE